MAAGTGLNGHCGANETQALIQANDSVIFVCQLGRVSVPRGTGSAVPLFCDQTGKDTMPYLAHHLCRASHAWYQSYQLSAPPGFPKSVD